MRNKFPCYTPPPAIHPVPVIFPPVGVALSSGGRGKREIHSGGVKPDSSPLRAAMKTKRSRNKCKACGNKWFPKGKNLSDKCPRCGSAEVALAGLGCLGWLGCIVILVVIAAVIYALNQDPAKEATPAASTPSAEAPPSSLPPVENAEANASGTWTDLDGRKMQGKLLDVKRDEDRKLVARFEKSDGKIYSFPVDQLVPEDKERALKKMADE
jgi:hypothetical protein